MTPLAAAFGRLHMGFTVHLIRIAVRPDQIRALEAFLFVPIPWLRLPGNLYALSDAHGKVLEQADPKIEFQYISKPPQNDQRMSAG